MGKKEYPYFGLVSQVQENPSFSYRIFYNCPVVCVLEIDADPENRPAGRGPNCLINPKFEKIIS